MKKIYSLVGFFAIFSFNTLAQSVSNESLSQLMGADLSTGTATAGIPIYTLQDGGLSVPIGLSYDAGKRYLGDSLVVFRILEPNFNSKLINYSF